ncbi:MAG: hypothetical protein U0794_18690 [Isosphaeraceae bacterium]
MTAHASLGRRQFLAASALGLTFGVWTSARTEGRRKRVAFLGTECRNLSHAQHFLDRMAMGYAWASRWEAPRVDLASVYMDQHPRGDLTPSRLERYKLRSYPTIAEALTLGGSKLAVDGVVIIAEHGDYPRNDKGQTLYPRYEFFKQVVKVFEDSGRSVPVFNDKHLSTTWVRCQEMVADSRRLGFPFMAGSSLPVTWRFPSIDMPHNTPLKESVCVGYGGVDSYDFHGLETAQCMSERRQGGEVGVAQVQALRGRAMWERLARSEHESTRRLMLAALGRSHNLPVDRGYPSAPISMEWAQQQFPEMLAYFVEHRDGFRTTLFLASIRDFNYAGLRADNGEIISCQMYLPMPTHGSTTADFFTPLVRHIETMFLENRSVYPIERTLLTSGMVIAAVDSLHRAQVPISTPEMNVAYKVGPDSFFRRE